jgi:Inositol-pentakisphosphate 2-kinase
VNLIRKCLVKDFKVCDNVVDISSVYGGTTKVHKRSCSLHSTLSLPPNCILSSILKAQTLVKTTFSEMEIIDQRKESVEADPDEKLVLENYKIGSTALDCSIMITIRRINGTLDKR